MIKFDDILTLIEKSKTPNVCISDLHGNKIVEISNSNVAATIAELHEYEPMLKMYGKLEVKAATAEGHKANYKGAYKWIMFFEKNADVQTPGNWKMPAFQMGQTPPGFVHASEMMFKLKEIELKMEYDKKMRELEIANKKEEDPIKKYGEFFPIVLSMMGKSDEQIEKMVRWHMMGKGMNMGTPAAISGVPATSTLTFKDVEKIPNGDKNNQMEKLLDEILTKVHCDKLKTLLSAFNDRPELAIKAVHALPLLAMNDPSIPEKHAATPDQVKNLNVILEQLPAKVSAEHMILILEAVNKNPGLVEKAIAYLPMM